MAEVRWIKITTDIFDDEKILLIESMPDRDGLLVIWFKLLCLAGRQNNSGVFILNDKIAFTDEMLATIFRRPINTVRLALQTFENFGMVEITDGVISIPNWEKHQSIEGMEKIREQTKKRVAKHREKQKMLLSNVTSNVSNGVTVTQCNATEEDKDKEEDKDNNILCMNAPSEPKPATLKPSKADIDEFFESIWLLYPTKKGKGQVSDSKKKELYSIGKDEMARAIKRYLDDLKKDASWRQPQNGSTFFNSGYVDYLDKNYTAPAERTDGNGTTEKSAAFRNVGTVL